MTLILLVEDNPSISNPLRLVFENEGHHVSLHDCAESAVEAISGDEPMELAVVDYWLGEGTDEPVQAALRDRRPEVRVLLISGGSPEVSVETTRWLGALDGIDGFLQKPFTRRDINAVFQRLGF